MLKSSFRPRSRSVKLARALRRSSTPSERILWERLRAHQWYGFHFRRQAPLGPYIADFLCVKRRLIIEIDGTSHDTRAAELHDQKRELYFRIQRFTVLRFRNEQVRESLDWVLMEIAAALMPKEAENLRKEFRP